MIRAVIFDFGGVVVSEGFQNWISDNVAPYETIRHEMIELQDMVDKGDLPVEAYGEFLSKKTKRDHKQIEKEILRNYSLNTDIVEIITLLRKKGMKIIILSNFPKKWFHILYEQFNLRDLFDEIIVSSEIQLTKPHIEIFQYAVKKLGVQPDESILIDDKKINIDGAERAGLHGIVFTSKEDLIRAFAKVDLLL